MDGFFRCQSKSLVRIFLCCRGIIQDTKRYFNIFNIKLNCDIELLLFGRTFFIFLDNPRFRSRVIREIPSRVEQARV